MVMEQKVENQRPNAGHYAKIREALWGEKQKETSCLEAAGQRIQVKRKMFEDKVSEVAKRTKMWSQELRNSHTVIDLEVDEDDLPASHTLEQAMENLMDEDFAGFHDNTVG